MPSHNHVIHIRGDALCDDSWGQSDEPQGAISQDGLETRVEDTGANSTPYRIVHGIFC